MNSNYIKSKSQCRQIMREQAKVEIKKQMDEQCPVCMTNIGYQTIGTLLWVLHRNFGWGTVRLNRLKDAVEDEFALMETGIPAMSKIEYTGNDCIRGLKEIGVDLEVSQYEK